MNIPEWTKKIHQNAIAKGWWDDGERDPDELCMLIVTEIAEAVEALRSPKRDRLCDKCEDSPGLQRPYDVGLHDYPPPCPKCQGTGEAIAGGRYREELADAAIRLLDLCGWYGIEVDAPDVPFGNWERPFRQMLLAGRHLEEAARLLRAKDPTCLCQHYSTLPIQNCTACRGTGQALARHPLNEALRRIVSMSGCTLEEFEAAIAEKHAYNQTRPHKHGKKF